jgi:hypothetical protein
MTFTELTQGVDWREQVYLNKVANGNLTLRLYTNNHTPAVGDNNAAYTECALVGYAAVTLAPGSWTGSSAAGVATYNYIAVTFTFSAYAGGTTIWGAYLTNGVPDVMLASLLDTAFTVPAAGGSVTITMTANSAQY